VRGFFLVRLAEKEMAMAAYGEFTPTDEQRAIAKAAAVSRPTDVPNDYRWRFILPGQPEARITFAQAQSPEMLAKAEIKTGLCWVEPVPLARTMGFDWMLRVHANGDDFLVRKGHFLKVLTYPSDSDAVGQSDGPQGGDAPTASNIRVLW
jgi:hypothetical protein